MPKILWFFPLSFSTPSQYYELQFLLKNSWMFLSFCLFSIQNGDIWLSYCALSRFVQLVTPSGHRCLVQDGLQLCCSTALLQIIHAMPTWNCSGNANFGGIKIVDTGSFVGLYSRFSVRTASKGSKLLSCADIFFYLFGLLMRLLILGPVLFVYA